MDLSINATRVGKATQKSTQNLAQGISAATTVPAAQGNNTTIVAKPRKIDLSLSGQLSASKTTIAARKLSVNNIDPFGPSVAATSSNEGLTNVPVVSNESTNTEKRSLSPSASSSRVAVRNLDASLIPEATANGNVGLALGPVPGQTQSTNNQRKASLGKILNSGAAQVNIGMGLVEDLSATATNSGSVSRSTSVKRSRMSSLPPLDPLTQARASNLTLDLDNDVAPALTASKTNLSHGSMRRLNSLNPLDGLGIEAISLSNQYIDQTGGNGIIKATSQQQLQQPAVIQPKATSSEIKAEPTSLTAQPKTTRKPVPPKKGISTTDASAAAAAATNLSIMPSAVTPNMNKRGSSINEANLPSSSPNVSRRNIANLSGANKSVLPKISAEQTTAAAAAAAALPKKTAVVGGPPDKELVVKFEEGPVLSAREIARKKAEEKNIWRYSKMDEARRQVYFQNKMRAKELAERTRKELLKKLRRDDDEDDDEITPIPTNVKEQPTKRISVATRKKEEQWQLYDKYISNIVDDTSIKQQHAYRTTFINDFTELEKRAVKEYENYWDMRVRDINVIPKHLIKPFTMEETTNMAWDMYSYLRSIGQPLFHYDLGKMLLVIIETDWSMADKLFEIQKLFAKLPKEVFLVLKSILTHLCRLSVSMKQDPHLFRPLSNIFAPLMFRLTARQNSIYNEEKYMTEHPSAIQYSVDSLDAECDSGDVSEGGMGSRDMDDFGNDDDGGGTDGLYDFSGETDVVSSMGDGGGGGGVGNGPHAPPASIAPTQMTTSSKRITPRSVITSKYSGTRASKMIEVEDLWHGKGGTTVASSNHSYEPPTMEEAIASVPGFKAEPIIRERTVFQPDLNNLEIPKNSPFNKSNIPDDEISFKEEDEFDSWVLKAMQDAANAYREKKGLPPLEAAQPEAEAEYVVQPVPGEEPPTAQVVNGDQTVPTGTSQEHPQESESEPQQPILIPPDLENYEKQTQYSQSTPVIPQEYQDLETFTGIRIEISETIEADIYLARTVPETLATVNEMDSLLAVLDSPMHVMFASDVFEIDRLPMVMRKSETEEVVSIPENPNTVEPEMKGPHITFLEEIDFGKGDPDGFGWNLVTKRQLAMQLFMLEECQGATAGLLELIIKNIDVLFEYNMHLTQERVGKMVVEEKLKADNQIGKENMARMKRL
ncbi:UNVERIFIED_CONTAM: hypothetical protein HDU68_009606 [Siphonaria sp. JEL0065]|nr:hypothetical protein HDU68_009606 [Siphonaria sp. JEL0065]